MDREDFKDEWLEQAEEDLRETHPDVMEGHYEIQEDGSVYLGKIRTLPPNTVMSLDDFIKSEE